MIKQGRMSTSLGFNILEKYNLSEYNNSRESTIFFGCYNPPTDFSTIMNHKALGILIWFGTDIDIINPVKLGEIKKKKNIKHIAIGGFIANDLNKAGIEFKRIPIHIGNNISDSQSLGNCIYSYIPKHKYNYYGGEIIDELKNLLPDEKFIITSINQYPRKEIMEFYKKSFIGLRLTKHDGLSATVIELGLMGRRCIYNDDIPNAINWRNIQDIIQIIKVEKLKIGQTNIQLVNAMSNFLNIDNSWLNEKFWQ